MAFKRRIPPPTPRQQARQDEARRLGCICCRIESERRGYPITAGWVQIHHQTDAGFTTSQDHTVAACSWHHQGHCASGYTSEVMRNRYGPSLAKGSKPFRAAYGSDAEQLAYQNALIARHRPDLIEDPDAKAAAE